MKGDLVKFPSMRAGSKDAQPACPMSIRIPVKQVSTIPECLINLIVSHCSGMSITCLGLIMDNNITINSYSKHLVQYSEQDLALMNLLTLFTNNEISRYKGRPLRLHSLSVDASKYPGLSKTIFYYERGLHFVASSIYYVSKNPQDIISKHLVDILAIVVRDRDSSPFLESFKAHHEAIEKMTPAYLFEKFECGLCVVANPKFLEVDAKRVGERTLERIASSTRQSQSNSDKTNKPAANSQENNTSTKVSNSGHIEEKDRTTPIPKPNDTTLIISGLKPGTISGL